MFHDFSSTSLTTVVMHKYCFGFFNFMLYAVGLAISSKLYVPYQTSCGSSVEAISVKRILVVRLCYCTYIWFSSIWVCYWLCVFVVCQA